MSDLADASKKKKPTPTPEAATGTTVSDVATGKYAPATADNARQQKNIAAAKTRATGAAAAAGKLNPDMNAETDEEGRPLGLAERIKRKQARKQAEALVK